jgi:hypothetical protein
MRALVALLLFALPVFAAPVPKGLKKGPPPKPDGAWTLVEFDSDGKGGNAQGMVQDWFIEGEHIFVGAKVEPAHGAKGPPNFTVTDPDRPHLRKWGTSAAAYELSDDGDTLRAGYAHDGRKELTECKPQQGVHFYVFKRVK